MNEVFKVHSKFTQFSSQLKDALHNFDSNPDFITKGERNVIKKLTVEGHVWTIKKFKEPNLIQSLVYRFVRKSKAERSFVYASKLIDLGIGTPFPVAYMAQFNGGLKESYYVCEFMEYDFDFRVLNHNPKMEHRTEILQQFTAFTYKLHEHNVNFLDHSPGNTLITENGDGSYNFYLIDLNRMCFESLNFEERMANFRRLWLSTTMIRIVAKKYAALYGKTYGETHAILSKKVRHFQKVKNSKKLRREKWRKKKTM